MSRPLAELIERLRQNHLPMEVLPERAEAFDITGLAYDSRRVRPGSLFFAIRGEHSDGHRFLADAQTFGAAAAVVEGWMAGSIPQILVWDTRWALAIAAAWWSGDPSLDLGVVGITGTDGKTTTSFLATAVLEAAGISTGIVTTAAVKVGDRLVANPEHVTTPQAPELQAKLREMVDAGNQAAIVETTSHGLALHRVDEIAYDVAIFTNLTHEHLELHGTFEAYRDAKVSLFERIGSLPAGARSKRLGRSWPRIGIVNADDPNARHFVDAGRRSGASILTYGIDSAADVTADPATIAEDVSGLSFDAVTPRWSDRVNLRLAGRFNVANALAAIALGEALELDPSAVQSGLAGLSGVPGRMERIDLGQPFAVVVDYAHSPAALEKVLDVLKPVAGPGAGLIAVFGSAGERDVQKRPLMGRVAGERCRLVVVTDEDPRGEDSQAILAEIAAGAVGAGRTLGDDVLCISDRREAIAAAFSRAQPGDVVLLAGKGHEQSIITAAGAIAWDERSEAIRALEALGYTDRKRRAIRTR